jgi:hypothetical protein
MAIAQMKVLTNQKLRKEPRRASDPVASSSGDIFHTLEGEIVNTGAKESVDETADGRTITWVFVEATEGQLKDLRKGYVSKGSLVAIEDTSVGPVEDGSLFAEQVEKKLFLNSCLLQAVLKGTNPAYPYALAVALSGDQWSATHVKANAATGGVYRISATTWQSVLADAGAQGLQPGDIKFPIAQCTVATVVAAKAADKLKELIKDRDLNARDLMLAHLFADTPDLWTKAAPKYLQAARNQPCADFIKAEVYPDDAQRTAFFERNKDIFGTDGSATIEQALKNCADKLKTGFDAVAALAAELEQATDDSDCPACLLKESIPSHPVGPISGGTDGSAVSGLGGGIVESQITPKKTRKMPIPEKLKVILEYAGRKTGLDVEVTSGGQPPAPGRPRTGSTRHDVDVARGLIGAADLLMRDAKTRSVLNSEKAADKVRIAAFITAAVEAGATGVGHASNYMGPMTTHIGGGLPPAAWGAGGRSANVLRWVNDAFNLGRANQLTKEQVAAALEQMRGAVVAPGPVVRDESSASETEVAPAGAFTGTLKTALLAALRQHEIGNKNPYQLFFASKGKSGASFGALQGDLAAGQAVAKTTFRDALTRAGISNAKMQDYLSRLSRPLRGNPLSPTETEQVNAALLGAKNLVDEMDEQIAQGVFAGLNRCKASAGAKPIEDKALLYMACWINMSGPPTSLLTWLSGGDPHQPGGRSPTLGSTVTAEAMEGYLLLTKYYQENKRNFQHMQDSVAEGAKKLTT